MKVEEYTRLKSRIDQLRQQKARAEGALEQAERRLVVELDVPVQYAERRIVEMEKEAEKLRNRVRRELEAFEAKWGEKLEEVG